MFVAQFGLCFWHEHVFTLVNLLSFLFFIVRCSLSETARCSLGSWCSVPIISVSYTCLWYIAWYYLPVFVCSNCSQVSQYHVTFNFLSPSAIPVSSFPLPIPVFPICCLSWQWFTPFSCMSQLVVPISCFFCIYCPCCIQLSDTPSVVHVNCLHCP